MILNYILILDPDYLFTREMTGQRGKLRALARICYVHESYFQPSGSLVFLTEVCFPRRMQSCLALRFLMTLHPLLHEIFAFLSNIRLRLARMRTSRKTNVRKNKDFRSSINSFRGHDKSQGLDREPPPLSPHFLLLLIIPLKYAYLSWPKGKIKTRSTDRF